MLILYFENLLFLFLVDVKLREYCRLQWSTIDICPSCVLYDFSNTIFCPIGSALTKHPFASQI